MTDYQRVRMLWPDHLGIARGKYMPGRLASNGTGHCASTFALGYDRSLIPAPGAYLLEGLRDVRSQFDPADLRPSWEDDRSGVAVCDLYLDDELYTFAPRFVLHKAIEDWKALGYRIKVGIELEGYVLEPDGNGDWKRWHTPRSVVYGTGRTADPAGLMDEIYWAAEASGIPVESMNAEFDSAQFELTLEYDDAMKAADDAFLFRVLAREKALERGLDFTFMGKPFPVISGSGLHVNFSFVDSKGLNPLAEDSADDGLSGLTRSCIAGLVEHHKALIALCAPTVNAYHRLQPGELAGYWANWGYDHRMTATRVPDARGPGTRIESRVADGSANIYTAIAAVLQAARLGVVKELECPAPLTSDGFEDGGTNVCAASSLALALVDLQADETFVEAVGADLVANFVANKQAEWERYTTAVGDSSDGSAAGEGGEINPWELNEYLPYH